MLAALCTMPRMTRLVAASLALSLAAPVGVANAGDDYFDKETEAGEMTFRVDKPRPRRAWILIGALGGAAAAFAGTGLLFHLSGDGKADEVSADGPTGLIWTPQRQDTFDSAVFRRRVGFTAYGLSLIHI